MTTEMEHQSSHPIFVGLLEFKSESVVIFEKQICLLCLGLTNCQKTF